METTKKRIFWIFQLFNKLSTTSFGQLLTIYVPGALNTETSPCHCMHSGNDCQEELHS